MNAADPNTAERPAFLGERLAALTAEHLLSHGRAIEASRARGDDGGEYAALSTISASPCRA